LPLHSLARGAFPFLSAIPPRRFMRLLAATEIATGTALLTPFVPAVLAGAALTACSGSLVTMYLRTPALRKPHSIWPNQAGIAVSKDIWMLGIGVELLADIATEHPGRRSGSRGRPVPERGRSGRPDGRRRGLRAGRGWPTGDCEHGGESGGARGHGQYSKPR
jgi:hypothetical protein